MDYFYMNERDREEGANPLVVVTDEDTGDKICPRCWTQRRGRARRNGLADPRHFPRTQVLGAPRRKWESDDGERSLKALRYAVARYHGGIVVPEVSARGESRSNGVAEQAAQVFVEFVRVLKEQFEAKTKMKLPPEDTILLWMVRWASTKYLVGADGRTPHERRRG